MCCCNINRLYYRHGGMSSSRNPWITMTFKNKSPGSDEATWDEAIVDVKNPTHNSNTTSKCLYLTFAHAPDRGRVCPEMSAVLSNAPPPPNIIHDGIRFRKGRLFIVWIDYSETRVYTDTCTKALFTFFPLCCECCHVISPVWALTAAAASGDVKAPENSVWSFKS